MTRKTDSASHVGADGSHKSVPEWASKKAYELTYGEQDRFDDYHSWLISKSARAFARYIAEHEEAPVDPLLEEADLIASGEHRWETLADYEGGKAVALAALRRGIEIGGAK